jgi:hypothetical protein
MGKIKDLTGNVYGKLTVSSLDTTKPTDRGAYWLCDCSCGNQTIVKSSSLLQGLTKSCGCFRKQSSKDRPTTHGESKNRLFKIWSSMVDRCKPNNSYGLKGITVCESWLDYLTFKEWALTNNYADNLSIDRIDGNLGYFPANCRWTTALIQARNKRKLPKSSSKFFGVHITQSGTYQALVQINGKKVFCKTYKIEEEAAKARDDYIIQNNLEGFNLNFN